MSSGNENDGAPEVPPEDYDSDPEPSESPNDPLREPDPPALDKLTEDLGQLLDSEVDTDVTIQAGGHSFPAHRVILKFRCPELLQSEKAVKPVLPPPEPLAPPSSSSCWGGSSKQKKQVHQPVEQSTAEKTQLSYVIKLPSPPFSVDLVRGLLRYIYTSRIEVLSGIVEELLVVAGDHRLLELKDRLEIHLCENVNDDNCVRLLIFADQKRNQWDCRKLKRKALKHIKKRIRLIIERQDFRNLKHGHCKLLEEVLWAVVVGDNWIDQLI